MFQHKLILASASPRRIALLADIGVVPDEIIPAEIEETPHKGELPCDLAARLAREKGNAIFAQNPTALVLSADTVVACGRRVLPKAETSEDVRHCLGSLSGRRHRVFTVVALFLPDGRRLEKLCESCVTFALLQEQQIETYVASGEGIGKAGGYAIQGRAAMFIRAISGSYSNIVGLPLYEVSQLLVHARYLP